MAQWVLVVAGGSGTRMNMHVPKQFLPLAGRPILMHTIEAFHAYDSRIQMLVILGREHWPTWENLCKRYHFHILAPLVPGGPERFHSVRNGIAMLPGSAEYVAIHDAVRPFVTTDLIHRTFKKAQETGAAVPGVPLKDSVLQRTDNGWKPLDRKSLMAVQTPQVFEMGILRKAYSQPYQERFTDDSSVVEASGHAVSVIEGEPRNFKITTPDDMELAEAMAREYESH